MILCPQIKFRIPSLWLILSGLAIACWPVLNWWFARTTDRSDDPLGVVALIVAVWFLWHRRSEIEVSATGAWVAAGIVVLQKLCALPDLVGGVAFVSALALALGLPRRQPGIVVLLLLSLPVIASLQFFAGYPMRLMAAEISHSLLGFVGIAAERVGTMLHWQGKEIGVDAACSGVNLLWTTSFLAGVLAVRARLNWQRCGALLVVAWGAILIANGIRAAVLFLPEAGIVHWPEWTHEGVGVALFIAVVGALFKLAERPQWRGKRMMTGRETTFHGTSKVAWFVMMIAAALLPVRARTDAAISTQLVWPETLEGEALREIPLSKREASFAAAFPGEMKVFQTTSGRTVIIRHILRASRALHSSADCLRASGNTLRPEPLWKDDSGHAWGNYKVHGPDGIHALRELITDANGGTFPDPSTWFWPAILGQSPGPWTAVTVME